MYKGLTLVATLVLLLMGVARAESPPPASIEAARSLVTTLKLADQYKALLPGILSSLRPVLSQDRPEIERDFDAMAPIVLETYQKYYSSMLDSAVALYANTFTADELRAIDAFYRTGAGQKYLEKSHDLAQQSQQFNDEISRKATEDLKARMTQSLREKGHKF
jgi:hypothetical protein